jgi:hypothetical protein
MGEEYKPKLWVNLNFKGSDRDLFQIMILTFLWWDWWKPRKIVSFIAGTDTCHIQVQSVIAVTNTEKYVAPLEGVLFTGPVLP